MKIKELLIEFREFLNELLLSGLAFIPLSSINRFKKYQNSLKKYNLKYVDKLLKRFLEEDNRAKNYLDLSLWVDSFILELEGVEVRIINL